MELRVEATGPVDGVSEFQDRFGVELEFELALKLALYEARLAMRFDRRGEYGSYESYLGPCSGVGGVRMRFAGGGVEAIDYATQLLPFDWSWCVDLRARKGGVSNGSLLCARLEVVNNVQRLKTSNYAEHRHVY